MVKLFELSLLLLYVTDIVYGVKTIFHLYKLLTATCSFLLLVNIGYVWFLIVH